MPQTLTSPFHMNRYTYRSQIATIKEGISAAKDLAIALRDTQDTFCGSTEELLGTEHEAALLDLAVDILQRILPDNRG